MRLYLKKAGFQITEKKGNIGNFLFQWTRSFLSVLLLRTIRRAGRHKPIKAGKKIQKKETQRNEPSDWSCLNPEAAEALRS